QRNVSTDTSAKANLKAFQRWAPAQGAWNLADDGWRNVLRTRLDDLKAERDWNLNTPKGAPLREMFRDSVGCEDITQLWQWNRMDAGTACKRLDEFVALRGAIAHRATAGGYVRKGEVERALGFVGRLVAAT